MRRAIAGFVFLVLTGSGLAACASEDQGTNSDPELVDAVDVPQTGLCRVLTPDDVALPSNATRAVPCTERHTAETFASGELPEEFADASYDDVALGRYAFATCSKKFARFVGADESLVLRTMMSWVWFRPSVEAWDKGARWYRCDVVGGNQAMPVFRPLPETAKGMLAGRPPDQWLSCARGVSVGEGEKVPCSKKHDWRAVTTVKIGQPDDAYPGEAELEGRTRSFCTTSVKAWLGYPSEFEYGFTYFDQDEWDAGVRRSVCWAKTGE